MLRMKDFLNVSHVIKFMKLWICSKILSTAPLFLLPIININNLPLFVIITLKIWSLTPWKVTQRSVTNKNIIYQKLTQHSTLKLSIAHRVVIKWDTYDIIDGVPRQIHRFLFSSLLFWRQNQYIIYLDCQKLYK